MNFGSPAFTFCVHGCTGTCNGARFDKSVPSLGLRSFNYSIKRTTHTYPSFYKTCSVVDREGFWGEREPQLESQSPAQLPPCPGSGAREHERPRALTHFFRLCPLPALLGHAERSEEWKFPQPVRSFLPTFPLSLQLLPPSTLPGSTQSLLIFQNPAWLSHFHSAASDSARGLLLVTALASCLSSGP